jgi:hypothetical protein
MVDGVKETVPGQEERPAADRRYRDLFPYALTDQGDQSSRIVCLVEQGARKDHHRRISEIDSIDIGVGKNPDPAERRDRLLSTTPP